MVIEEKSDSDSAAYFQFIKSRYKLPYDKNFHAVGLFEDKRSDFYISDSSCRKFCKSVGEFIETSPFVISVSCLDKNALRELLKMPKGYGFRGDKEHREDKEIGYEILARKVFLEFAQFLKSKKAQGSIIAESRRGVDYRLLKTFLESQEPNQFNRNSRLQTYVRVLRENVFSICFENKSGLNAGLEMADLISYLANQKITKRLGDFEGRGSKLLWKVLEKRSIVKSLSPTIFKKFAGDRIHKIANRIEIRLKENRDLIK